MVAKTIAKVAKEKSVTTSRVESNKGDEYLDKLLASKDEQVSNLKEHVDDLRSQLSKKDALLTQAHSMIASMQEGQDSARDLIKMLGENVIDLSRRALPSGSQDSNVASNRAIQANNFDTQFATTSDDLATHDG